VSPTPSLDDMTPEQLRATVRGFREAARGAVGEAAVRTFIRLADRYDKVAEEREAAVKG
jgi:hypothetical protein